jgi:3-deoxy-D-manno-octulosonic-acid transferase
MILPALYAGAATLAAPALRVMLLRRARRGKEIQARLDERRGIDPVPRPAGRLVWLHAASVGETVSILPVLAELSRLAPDATVLVTTGTVTSAAMLAQRLGDLGLEGRVWHRFVPLDVPAWVARFLDHWRPDAAAFVESEIWPNLLRACRRRSIPVMLFNARLSPRSFARWQRLPGLARNLFSGFSRIHAQTSADAERLRALGADADGQAGNLKFAADPLPADETELARLRAMLEGRPLWLAASTHPGEDAAILAAHDILVAGRPRLLTIIVPRHPERGAEIAMSAAPRPATRRSLGAAPPGEGGVWIADTLGELGLFYRLSAIAFVGRSLGAQGGQNPLEPARLGCAVAVGPHVQNFAEAATVLEQAGALTRVENAAALAEWVAALLADPARRERMGEAGIRAAQGFAGLPARVAGMICALLPERG